MAFALGSIGLSFFFSWLVKAAGGRPLAGLMVHGTNNAIIALFPTIAAEADASQVRWWLHQTLLLVVGALFLRRVAGRRERTLAGDAGRFP